MAKAAVILALKVERKTQLLPRRGSVCGLFLLSAGAEGQPTELGQFSLATPFFLDALVVVIQVLGGKSRLKACIYILIYTIT